MVNKNLAHLKVRKQDAQRIKKWLQRNQYLNRNFKVQKDDEHVFFPLTSENVDLPVNFSGCQVVNLPGKLVNRPPSLEMLFRSYLPSSLHDKLPRSFDHLGQIIIVKLDKDIWPWRFEIGKAFLESYPRVKAVYAKKSKVTGEFRVLPLELIAGTDVDFVIVKEHGIKLFVRFKEVFYNPRLANQHQKVAISIPPRVTVLDAFCGVGTFGLHLATMKPCTVFSVDLNPLAIECLTESMRINRVKPGRIHPITGDVTTVFSKNISFDHVIMNLPEYGFEFFPSMFELVKKDGGILHFHVFERFPSIQDQEQVLINVKEKLTSLIRSHGLGDAHFIESQIVRDVAPGKLYLYFKMKRFTKG